MTDKRIDGTEVALKAISNQFETMCYEKWQAEKRICALKAEIARRAAR